MDRRSHGTSKLGLWFSAVLILVVGVAGSLAIFGLIRRGEHDAAVERFALRADWRATDLENKINSDALPVAGIAAHLSTLRELTATDFERVVAARYAYAPERRPLVVSWVARVPAAERGVFEASVRAAGVPDFAIRNFAVEQGQQRLVLAPAREVHYPVQLGIGFEGVPRPLGIDFAANDARRATIERALDSGEPRSLTFVPRQGVAPLADLGISIYVPVYAGEGIPADPAERRARARGVVGGTFLVERLLGRAIEDTPALIERILVFDERPGSSAAAAIAEFSPGDGEFRVRAGPIDVAALPGLRLERTIDVAGTPWYLVFSFAPELIAAQRSGAPWAWLASGLTATVLLALAMFLAQRRAGLMELLATSTAADLAVTDRNLRQANLQIAAIVEASPIAIVSLDGAGRVTSWNPAAERITGYDASETVGSPPPMLASADAAMPARDGETIVKAMRRDGSEIELLLSSAPIASEGGGPAGRIVVALDVTERNRLDRQLHQLQKMETVGQLTGGLAHDFNNLLGIIIGNLDLLAERLAKDSEGSELAQAALSAGLRGADLNRALLAFSRRQPLQPRVIDVNEVVRGMTTLLRRTLGEQIEVRLLQAPDLANALIDPAQLEAALLNLSVNARDAMPRGGSLTIETVNMHLDESYVAANADVTLGDYVAVSVTDTGTGMSAEVATRAFEPFFTTKEVGKGTGLGLSMVYGFIKQSGGHAKIYSEPGHGTTVRLYLPRAEGASARVDGVKAAKDAAPSGRETVLVVEDNEELRAVAVRLLDELGYRIREVRNGHEALDLLRGTHEIDLLFSDIVMPGGLDGRMLATEAVKLRPGLKVLLTSGFTEASGIAEGVLGGAVSFVSKPYRRHDLARRIRQVLDNG